jgi:hypothetical protein
MCIRPRSRAKCKGALQQLSACYCRQALYLYQRNAKQDSTNVVCTSCVGKEYEEIVCCEPWSKAWPFSPKKQQYCTVEAVDPMNGHKR